MARDGDGIYESDAGLNYLYDIKSLLMKEVAYWFTPEQVHFCYPPLWLREALTMLEMMVLLGEVNPKIHLMKNEIAIERWRKVFFSVWDGDWTVDYHLAYSAFAYRVEHRSLVNKLFDHLDHLRELADDDWHPSKPDEVLTREPFLLEGRLPHFSGLPFITSERNEAFETGQYLSTFLHMLTRDIVYIFSEEYRGKERGVDVDDLEQVWVSIDVIAFLCEKYQISPRLRVATIQRWLDMTITLWLEYYERDWGKTINVETLIEKDDRYPDVVAVFVRLMNIARRHAGSWGL